jgi:hypothetical protein
MFASVEALNSNLSPNKTQQKSILNFFRCLDKNNLQETLEYKLQNPDPLQDK